MATFKNFHSRSLSTQQESLKRITKRKAYKTVANYFEQKSRFHDLLQKRKVKMNAVMISWKMAQKKAFSRGKKRFSRSSVARTMPSSKLFLCEVLIKVKQKASCLFKSQCVTRPRSSYLQVQALSRFSSSISSPRSGIGSFLVVSSGASAKSA